MVPTGFSRTVKAPARSASMGMAFHFPDSVLAATTTMGIGLFDMILRVASSPSMPGSRMSIAMTSGEKYSSVRSASSARGGRRADLKPGVAPDTVFEQRANHGRILDNHYPNLFHIICRIAFSNSV